MTNALNVSQTTYNFGKIFREVKDFILIGIGMLLYAIGWTVFLLANDLPSGGVTGLSSIVFWGTGLPVQYTYLTINGILLVISIIVMGWKFSIKTIFAVFVLSSTLPIIQAYTEELNLIRDQPFMACLLGAVFCGSGVGIAFSANGSTGGTDIIAAVINKYRDVSLGHIIMLVDVLIITSSYIVLQDLEKVLYGFVVLFVQNFVVDQIVNATRLSVQFFIISKKYEEIGARINKDLGRGVTFIDGVGAYTRSEVKMMFVLAKKRESSAIFRLIKDIDPKAFVSQSAVIGVFGEGFDKIKA